MQIDVILTDKEVNLAVQEYLIKNSLITDDFMLIKTYRALNSYMFSNMEEDKKEAKENARTIRG